MFGCLPGIAMDLACPENAKEKLFYECESIWKQMEQCQTKLTLLGVEKMLKSDAELHFSVTQIKALTAECNQWKKSPEVIPTNPDLLLALGKEELQKVRNCLQMVLSTVQGKNEKLDEALKREEQWHKEQEHIVNILARVEKKRKTPAEQLPKPSLATREFNDLNNEVLKLKAYKEELLTALNKFLDEYYPLPERSGSDREMANSSEEPTVKLITMLEILEILINKLIVTPHEPYVTINDSFWPPYIELLLRCGIVLRHPEDPNRIRLEAFHM